MIDNKTAMINLLDGALFRLWCTREELDQIESLLEDVKGRIKEDE